MNEKNFEYLKDTLKYTGFGDRLHQDLEGQLRKQPPDFQLGFTAEVHKKQFEATLNFRKSANSDLYFFNSYHASLKHPAGQRDQVFYINNGKGVTAKEAYNLLEGRAVLKELANKEGQPYKAWLQLDFDKKDKHNNHEVKQFHENYGFDLKGALSKYALVELNDVQKEKALLQSLQKGNRQAVTVENEGGVTKLFIEANPQFKSVSLYDAQLNRLPSEKLGMYQKEEKPGGPEMRTDQLSKDAKAKTTGNEKDKNENPKHAPSGLKAPNKAAPSLNQPTEGTGRSVKRLLPQKEGDANTKGLKPS